MCFFKCIRQKVHAVPNYTVHFLSCVGILSPSPIRPCCDTCFRVASKCMLCKTLSWYLKKKKTSILNALYGPLKPVRFPGRRWHGTQCSAAGTWLKASQLQGSQAVPPRRKCPCRSGRNPFAHHQRSSDPADAHGAWLSPALSAACAASYHNK